MKSQSKDEEIPWVVLSLLLVFAFLPVVENIYYSFVFCPRHHGESFWEAFKFELSWGHWECLWAFMKTAPGLVFNGMWLLSILGLLALYNFPQLLALGRDNQEVK